MNIDEFVIDKIYSLMQQRGWSQKELARQAKINYENLNRLLKGGRSITKSDVLGDIAKAFNISLDELKAVDRPISSPLLAPDRSTLILEIQGLLNQLDSSQLEILKKSAENLSSMVKSKNQKSV